MHKTIIKANTGKWLPDFTEIFRFKELLLALAWRDIRIKYAQTYIGLLWAFINPVLNLVVLSFVFGIVVKVDTGDVPHLLFTIAGLSAWTYFATLLGEAGSSILSSQAMIKKIYFPRIVIPLSKAISGFIDLGVTLICLLIFMIYYGYVPGTNVIWLPAFIGLAIFAGLGGGILVSALSVRYRDFSFIVPLLVRIGLYATPIAYSASAVPEQYKAIYYLNPMAGVVEGFRWSLFGSGSFDPYFFYSFISLFMLFVVSLVVFARIEHKIADII